MSKYYYISIILIATGLFFSCKGDGEKTKQQPQATKIELKESISQMKDSLKLMSKEGQKIGNIHRIELINRLLEFYKSNPKDSYSAECLDEVQMIYSMLEAYEYAAAYSDTLIQNYPDYKNRALVLEGQGSNYDIFITPRDSSKVRKYYSMLLKEYPKLDKEKRDGIRKRLNKNHLDFDQYIEEVTADLK